MHCQLSNYDLVNKTCRASSVLPTVGTVEVAMKSSTSEALQQRSLHIFIFSTSLQSGIAKQFTKSSTQLATAIPAIFKGQALQALYSG